MSLTGVLDDRNSSLRRWFDPTFPALRAVQPAGRWKGPLGVTAVSGVPWRGRVGTAFDYRVRWYWPWVPADRLLATHLAPDLLGAASARDMVGYLDTDLGPRLQDPTRVDADHDEAARAALVLAQLETVLRSGLPPDPRTTGIVKGASVESMLAAQDSAAVDDVVQLERAARPVLRPLSSLPSVLNPAFTWSARVGGADADLIVDGCLIDLKATSDTGLSSEVIRQLIGYALLDGPDRYNLTSVGVFFARRPQLLRWPLDEFLSLCAGRAVTCAELRAQVDAVLPKVEMTAVADAMVKLGLRL